MKSAAEKIINRVQELEQAAREKRQRNQVVMQNAQARLAEIEQEFNSETDPERYEQLLQEQIKLNSTIGAMQNAARAKKAPVLSNTEYKEMREELTSEMIALQDAYAPKLEAALQPYIKLMSEYSEKADALEFAHGIAQRANNPVAMGACLPIYSLDKHAENKDNWLAAFTRAYCNNMADVTRLNGRKWA